MLNGFRFPHPLVLIVGFIILAAALSYVLPAGEFTRHLDAVTGRQVVVAGSYHAVPATPVGPLDVLVDVPKGMADAAAVVFLIFLAGGAFTVVDQTGALRFGIDWLLRRAHGREVLVIPLVGTLFATMGALENMGEEIIPLVPVLLVLMRRLGYPTLTAVAASVGAAFVGASFSPINPFQVGIAQKLAQLPLLSGGAYRMGFLLVAVGLWLWATTRHAVRHRQAPDLSLDANEAAAGPATTSRSGLVLLLMLAAFGVFAYGVVQLHWEFEQMAALFLGLGIVAGLVGGRGLTGTAEGFIAGFRDIAFSALLIGFARAIFVVLEQGHIVDTIVHGLAEPLGHLPVALASLGMMGVQTLLHVPVPSGSGQATLTMPLLVPLSDILGLSRQVTVLAFQYGAGLCELITPTNGTLMAMLAATGVRFEQWIKFAAPLWAALFALGAVAVVVGIAAGV
ncbi:YfcC family protein [Hymenobacter artigasi]|uniref:Ion transporter superfamily protein YfcC n=1 Tax=Hymenobacter artigasi TaxID=2719616 RepID=A0ABX1HPJ1_9BACT|nr:YfcC family protein [Hymenobacter artigasi]NKI91765.1 putative ion transporter superfamily protein YfcC [Hymenobacter artigasi]